ncbi:hypothetical protein [Thermoactinomyces sp. CICC 10521]|uniref:hypothetical protein n=1 Tax=Thermoactinomyces sp. CICC 10521 TaxID=2767426 RepID=UPI0018DC5A59|nr:hypothetical protein [Thermoactinomyces sp. CICC 10521]MBH8608926.1 hypothetical protein [Thermoactinomyces sp. CICC 10521]
MSKRLAMIAISRALGTIIQIGEVIKKSIILIFSCNIGKSNWRFMIGLWNWITSSTIQKTQKDCVRYEERSKKISLI